MKEQLIEAVTRPYQLSEEETRLLSQLADGTIPRPGDEEASRLFRSVCEKTKQHSVDALLTFLLQQSLDYLNRSKFFVRIPNVLIAEDEPEMLDVIASEFRIKGCVTFPFTEFKEEHIPLILEKQMDLLVIDLRMKPLQGDEIIRRIKQKTGFLPPTLLTTADDSFSEKEAEDLGVLLLRKPFLMKDLFHQAVQALVRGPSTVPGARRRTRVYEVLKVTLGDTACATDNLSSGGMFLRLADPSAFEIGRIVDFSLELPDGKRPTGQAVIRWKNKVTKGLVPAGIGVEFTSLDNPVRDWLNELALSKNVFSLIAEARPSNA